MLSITKIFKFEAAHYLSEHPGKCKNMHGHSYTLEVEVCYGIGQSLPPNMMVIDFGDLKKLIDPYIEEKLDHKLLNETFHVDYPTAEFLVDQIVSYVKNAIVPYRPLRVRLWETDTCYAEWRES